MDIEKRPASRTAISVAALRAMHQLYDDSPKILSDPIIPLFFEIEVLQKAKANLEWYRDPLTTALRSHVVLRSRYAEDSLHEAVISGVNQYIILGAGLDTFAYRQPAWAAPLRIFEVALIPPASARKWSVYGNRAYLFHPIWNLFQPILNRNLCGTSCHRLASTSRRQRFFLAWVFWFIWLKIL